MRTKRVFVNKGTRDHANGLTEQVIRNYLSNNYGPVISNAQVKLQYSFYRFEQQAHADAAVQNSPHFINGFRVKLQYAHEYSTSMNRATRLQQRPRQRQPRQAAQNHQQLSVPAQGFGQQPIQTGGRQVTAQGSSQPQQPLNLIPRQYWTVMSLPAQPRLVPAQVTSLPAQPRQVSVQVTTFSMQRLQSLVLPPVQLPQQNVGPSGSQLFGPQ